jgi:hypothetical protein
MEHLSIVATLRTVADVIDDAMRVGVPEPQTVSVTWHSPPTLIMGEFADVEEWALYLETDATTRTSAGGRVEHRDTEADLTDTYGLTVRVTTNRQVPLPTYDGEPAADAYTERVYLPLDGLKP